MSAFAELGLPARLAIGTGAALGGIAALGACVGGGDVLDSGVIHAVVDEHYEYSERQPVTLANVYAEPDESAAVLEEYPGGRAVSIMCAETVEVDGTNEFWLRIYPSAPEPTQENIPANEYWLRGEDLVFLRQEDKEDVPDC